LFQQLADPTVTIQVQTPPPAPSSALPHPADHIAAVTGTISITDVVKHPGRVDYNAQFTLLATRGYSIFVAAELQVRIGGTDETFDHHHRQAAVALIKHAVSSELSKRNLPALPIVEHSPEKKSA
jgi:hypothetical protein